MIQNLIVILVVVIAVGYLVQLFWKQFSGTGNTCSTACGKCHVGEAVNKISKEKN